MSLTFSNFAPKTKVLQSMKKQDSTTREESLEEEVKRLRKENKSLVKENAKKEARLKTQKAKLKQTRDELKKKDATTITLTKEQTALISALFPDIDIHSL